MNDGKHWIKRIAPVTVERRQDEAVVEVIIAIESRKDAEEQAMRIQELLDRHLPGCHVAIRLSVVPTRDDEPPCALIEAEGKLQDVRELLEAAESRADRAIENARVNEDTFAKQLQYDGEKIKALESRADRYEKALIGLIDALLEYGLDGRIPTTQARERMDAALAAARQAQEGDDG